MVKQIWMLALIATTAFACKQEKPAENQATEVEAAAPQATYQNITVTQLKEKLAQTTKPVLLDVRTPGEVAEGIIEGATVIDINDPAFMDKVKALDKTVPTVVYCKVGGRSSTACAVMSEMGFTELYNLEGGYDAWKMQQ